MRFSTQIEVVGMKSSKGTLENGQSYDSTKVYALIELDEAKGNAKGRAATEYTFGTSEEFSKFKHLPFPLICDAVVEIVSSGRTQKTQIVELKPLSMKKAA
jgi:hypothetical protein